jgi:hypothetical protein
MDRDEMRRYNYYFLFPPFFLSRLFGTLGSARLGGQEVISAVGWA